MGEHDYLVFHAQRLRRPPRRAEGSDRLLPGVPAVFQYRLVDQPDALLCMIARSGTDIDGALDKLAAKFGAERVLEVRANG